LHDVNEKNHFRRLEQDSSDDPGHDEFLAH
jgi:hypothetical protein